MPDIKLEEQLAYCSMCRIEFETLRHFIDENSGHSNDYSLVFNSLKLDFTDYNPSNNASSAFQLLLMSNRSDIG